MRLKNYKVILALAVVVLGFVFWRTHSIEDLKPDGPLSLAAWGGEFAKVKEYVDKGVVKVNHRDSKNLTGLHCAAAKGHQDIVDYLISKGADVTLQDGNYNTPLHYGAAQGNEFIVKALVGKGAKVDVTNKKGETPLYNAIKNIRYNNVEYLLSKGAKISSEDMALSKDIHEKLSKKDADFYKVMTDLGLGDERRDKDKTIGDAGWINSKLAAKYPDQKR